MHFQTVLSGFWEKNLFEAPAIVVTVNREGFAKNYSHARSMKHLGSLFFFLVKENPDYIGGEEARNHGHRVSFCKNIHRIIFIVPKLTMNE